MGIAQISERGKVLTELMATHGVATKKKKATVTIGTFYHVSPQSDKLLTSKQMNIEKLQ